MAKFRHISTKLVLALDAGQVNGKKVTKRVTIGGIKEDASADALWELAEALGKLLAYPVAEVRLYKVEELVREEGDGTADKKGGAQKEADADDARADGAEALPAAASRVGVRTGNGSFMRKHVKEAVSYIPAGFDTGSPRCARDDRGNSLSWRALPLPREALFSGFSECREAFFPVYGYAVRGSPFSPLSSSTRHRRECGMCRPCAPLGAIAPNRHHSEPRSGVAIQAETRQGEHGNRFASGSLGVESGRGSQVFDLLSSRVGAGRSNARNRREAAVFPGAAARMNSPPLSRGLLMEFRVMPIINAGKKEKEHGAGKYLRFFVR